MTIIANIDGPTRRIFLHADTVNASVHPIDIYREMRALRVADESLRSFDVFIKAAGHETTGPGEFTARSVTLQLGTRIVPFDSSHELTIIGILLTDEGTKGIAAFDKTLLSGTSSVDINYIPPQVEVVEVATGGLTVEQSLKLIEIHDRLDLNVVKPNTYNIDGSKIENGEWVLDNTDNGNGTSTVQRS